MTHRALHRLFAPIAFAAFMAGCTEYSYRHEFTGQVLDHDGKPVADAFVARIDEKGKSYGIDEVYKRKTDKSGHFSFVNQGKGPKPSHAAPWRVAVDAPNRPRATFDLELPWSNEARCTGYCLQDMSLVLK